MSLLEFLLRRVVKVPLVASFGVLSVLCFLERVGLGMPSLALSPKILDINEEFLSVWSFDGGAKVDLFIEAAFSFASGFSSCVNLTALADFGDLSGADEEY